MQSVKKKEREKSLFAHLRELNKLGQIVHFPLTQ